MTQTEIQVKINIAQKEADFWKDILKKKSCNDCAHWRDGCQMAGGEIPPVEVIKSGCDVWVWDDIAF